MPLGRPVPRARSGPYCELAVHELADLASLAGGRQGIRGRYDPHAHERLKNCPTPRVQRTMAQMRAGGLVRSRVHLSLLLLAIASGCTNEDADPGRDLDGSVVPHLDGGMHPPVELPTTCEGQRTFLSAHRWCAKSSDCVIVGACSGGFGFRAVERAVQTEAQTLSDRAKCDVVFDGPTYNAVCEQGVCTARPTQGACGAPQRDGGVYGCPRGQEQYLPSCETPMTFGFDTQGCETHCDGADDTSCGAGRTCKQVKVLPVVRAGCDLIDVWLCRPAI
jgi:hypothetical protein